VDIHADSAWLVNERAIWGRRRRTRGCSIPAIAYRGEKGKEDILAENLFVESV